MLSFWEHFSSPAVDLTTVYQFRSLRSCFLPDSSRVLPKTCLGMSCFIRLPKRKCFIVLYSCPNIASLCRVIVLLCVPIWRQKVARRASWKHEQSIDSRFNICLASITLQGGSTVAPSKEHFALLFLQMSVEVFGGRFRLRRTDSSAETRIRLIVGCSCQELLLLKISFFYFCF